MSNWATMRWRAWGSGTELKIGSIGCSGCDSPVLIRGNAPAIADAIRALGPAGRAVLVGMGGDEIPLPLSVVQERELEITGTFRYANTWPTAIALVASGRVDVERLVTGTYPLDQAEQALTANRRDQQSVKVVVHPQT